MNPKFSVIIPVYNSERFVAKAVDSALNQSYRYHEIIVIDDGSTDATPEILKKYGGKIITGRIKHTGSPSTPMNTALRMVTGDHIAFLDSDDLWFRSRLEKTVGFIRKFPEIGLFSCNFAVRWPQNKMRLKKRFNLIPRIKGLNFNSPLRNDAFQTLLRNNFIGICSNVVVRKEIVDQTGDFDDGVKYTEDFDYLLRCARITNFLLISDVLVYKRTHDSNLTNDYRRTYAKNENVLRKHRLILAASSGNREMIRGCDAALARHYYAVGDYCLGIRKVREAFLSYFQAFISHKTFFNFIYSAWKIFRKFF